MGDGRGKWTEWTALRQVRVWGWDAEADPMASPDFVAGLGESRRRWCCHSPLPSAVIHRDSLYTSHSEVRRNGSN